MNKEILKHYYDEGKKFGYALARGATDLPSVQTFDELYTEQLNKPLVMQAEGSDEHICKYCGVLTSQPDEDCYKNPNRAKEATVASEGQDTVAEGVDTVGCIKCGKRFNHLTELWKHLDECAEAPSDGQP